MGFRRTREQEKMHDLCTYHVRVQGWVEEKVLNASSPLRVTVVRADAEASLLSLRADQSGLIGLIRHLHGHGFVLLSVCRER